MARATFATLAVGTIAIGLSVHWCGGILAAALQDVIADALWAAMITWWIGAALPSASLGTRGALALAVCFAVELTQLCHFPVLDAIRRTTVGQLVLGTGFEIRDFASYALGVSAAMFVERIMRGRGRRASQRGV